MRVGAKFPVSVTTVTSPLVPLILSFSPLNTVISLQRAVFPLSKMRELQESKEHFGNKINFKTQPLGWFLWCKGETLQALLFTQRLDFRQCLTNLGIMIIPMNPRINVCKDWNLAGWCWRSSRNRRKTVCTKKCQLFCLHGLQCTAAQGSLNCLGTVTVQTKLIGIEVLQVPRLNHLFVCQLYFSIPAWEVVWENEVLSCLNRSWPPTDANKDFLTVFTLSWL